MFSACKTEFKHMEYFYFHNFIYDNVWKDNARRTSETTPLYDVLNTFSNEYKVIFVGDASMSPYEIMARFGSVEYMNEEPGAAWMQRLTDTFNKVVWLNPVDERHWSYTQSIEIVHKLLDGRMYPMTLEGLDKAIAELQR